MNRMPSLLRQLNNPSLNRDQRAQLRCRIAKELEEAGKYEDARRAMGELWQRIGERPKLDGLDKRTAAEVLLRAGVLSGWLGSAHQVAKAQDTAKDLINESGRIFESLGLRAKAAEAQIELAPCYWREGGYDEARITLNDAIDRLGSEDDELKALALLRRAIIERSATRFNDALSILNNAVPLVEASSNQILKGNFHNTLAIVLRNLGETERWEEYRDRALIEYAAASVHYERAGHKRYLARVENNLGFLLSTASRFEEAHEHLDRARRLFVGLKDKGSVAQVDDTRARALLAEGRNSEAERVVRSAVRTLEKGDEQGVLARALTTHGTALVRLGRDFQAHSALQRAIDVAHVAGDNEDAGIAALTMIEELDQRLEPDEMRMIYKRADDLLTNSKYPQTLQRLREAARLVLAAGGPRVEVARVAEVRAPKFVYASKKMGALVKEAQRVAVMSEPVLITGEEGTGKELLGRLIHEWSGRKGQFVAVNCATLNETLVESQLFGHKKGSLKDIVEEDEGAVRRARRGTLFLDEIGELSSSNQAKLLRLIERNEIHPLGANVPERVDVRIVAASNCDLEEEVERELFREDLFYRLQTFHLSIPPLRMHPDDIPVLASHFIKEANERYGQRVIFTPEAVEAMRKFPLKGNARELQMLIERTVATASRGTVITRNEVETLALRQAKTINLADAWDGCVLYEEVRRYEGSLIRMALDATKGHITRAAHMLGTTHQGLAFILQGRHKDLLAARTPVRRRRRSIIKTKKD